MASTDASASPAVGWRMALAWFSLAASVSLAAVAPTRSIGLALFAFLTALVTVWTLTPGLLPLRLYVAALASAFAVFPSLAGEPLARVAPVISLLAVWLFALGFGAHLATVLRGRSGGQDDEKPTRRNRLAPFVALGSLGLVLQAVRYLGGADPLTTQLRGEVSIGPEALLRAGAPAALAVAFWLARLTNTSNRWRFPTALGVSAQAGLLLFSGFRGAAPIYLLTIWLTGVANGSARATRSSRRRTVVVRLVVAVVILGGLVQFAAVRRDEIAGRLGMAGSGTRTFSAADPLAFAERYNYARYVNAALDRPPESLTSNPSSATAQLAAFVPRAVWPGKPVIDYGRDVAFEYFDVPRAYRSSETITFLGDLYVMAGPFGVGGVGAGVGALLTLLLTGHRRAPTQVSIALTFLASTTLVNFENPLILNAANAIRVGVTLGALGLAARLLPSRSDREIARHSALLPPEPMQNLART